MRNYLGTKANFGDIDFANLENGRLVTKLLTASNKREVAVLGFVPIKSSPDLALQAFQESLLRQNQRSNDFGFLSNTPLIEDLRNLTLEDRDIEDLKQCQPGNCKVRLSAAMIGRFQKEIDWNAPDYPKQANQLYQQIILDYVRDYLSRGDAALIDYNDKNEVIRLQDEQEAILKESLWLNEYAPEFYDYLQKFPHSEPLNVSQTIAWAKVKFGLKPVTIITQTFTYKKEEANGATQILSVSKQLYANHYFDSSLALTALIALPQSEKTYLLYTNYSRSDALGGAFSKLMRGTIEKEALAKLKPLLLGTKYYAESKLSPGNETNNAAFGETNFGQLFSKNLLIWLLAGALLLMSLIWFVKQIGKREAIKYRY